MFKEVEEVAAYAKIQNEGFVKFIRTPTVFLGREVSIAEQAPDEEILFISESHKISRKHLKLFWDETKGKWYAQNLSKNHVYVNKSVLKKDDKPKMVSPIASIKIDDCKFYFFEARDDPDANES